jgi:ketosteroid isomerase-like protein
MSQENVEIIRRGVQEWNRRGIEGILPLLHPDIRAYPFPEWVGPKVYSGRAGFRELAREWTENFEDYKWDAERIFDADDRVVALVYHRGRVRNTSVPISQPIGAIWGEFRDGTTATCPSS